MVKGTRGREAARGRERSVGHTTRTRAARTAGVTWIDVFAIAAARAVVDVRESRMEVRVCLDEVGHAVGRQVGVHVVHVDAVAQSVVGEYGAIAGVTRAALVAGEHAAYRDA